MSCEERVAFVSLWPRKQGRARSKRWSEFTDVDRNGRQSSVDSHHCWSMALRLTWVQCCEKRRRTPGEPMSLFMFARSSSRSEPTWMWWDQLGQWMSLWIIVLSLLHSQDGSNLHLLTVEPCILRRNAEALASFDTFPMGTVQWIQIIEAKFWIIFRDEFVDFPSCGDLWISLISPSQFSSHTRGWNKHTFPQPNNRVTI